MRSRPRRPSSHPTHRPPPPAAERPWIERPGVQWFGVLLTASTSLALVVLLRPAAATTTEIVADAETPMALTATAAAVAPAATAAPLPGTPVGELDLSSLSEATAADPVPTTTAASPTTVAPSPTSTTAPTTTVVTTTAPTTTTPPEGEPEPVETADPTTVPETTPPRDALEGRVVTIHGDSLTVAAERELRQALAPAAVEINAEVGQSLIPAAPRITGTDYSGLVDVVVIALGTNDWGAAEFYDQLVANTLEALSGVRCVVWVTPQDFREGHAEIIDTIWEQTDLYTWATVADWSVVAGPADLHESDGFHLSPLGRERFAVLVAATVRNCAGASLEGASLEGPTLD